MIPKCKQDKKLAEQVKNELNKTFKRFETIPSIDFNNNFENGIYWYNSGCTNIPNEQYGVILVISSPVGNKNDTNYWWTFQIAFSTNDNIFIRHSFDGTTWTDWIKK